MRLLFRQEDGSFKLAEFESYAAPPYAILSHTWGQDHEEVTHHDIVNQKGQAKAGYRKLTFCAKQAEHDGLQYFWIDTCCIDKLSSAELSEAINSMFKWYRKADRCYVWLTDVSLDTSTTVEDSIAKSRWFKRGWTLQELLAPSSVEFFSADCTPLGTKLSLTQVIHNITGISHSALEGETLNRFSVETRLSWADKRQTKKEEDAAYSMLGILDVFMTPIYGEGRTRALQRLRRELAIQSGQRHSDGDLIRGMQSLSTSSFEAVRTEVNVRATSLPREQMNLNAIQAIQQSLRYHRMDERRRHIQDAQIGTYGWILDPDQHPTMQRDNFSDWISAHTDLCRIYWLYGKPGSGKSTIMQYLDQNLALSDCMITWTNGLPFLKLTHFLWAPGSDLQRSLTGLLRSLLYQILIGSHTAAFYVLNARTSLHLLAPNGSELEWTVHELQDTLHDCIRSLQKEAKVLILIDGLDELSGGDETREEIIKFLNQLACMQHVKICASSRPLNVFLDAFAKYPGMRLEDHTGEDIDIFVQEQLSGAVPSRCLSPTSANTLKLDITARASGVFLWVNLVTRELLAGMRNGDTLATMQRKLYLIPTNLELYFRRLVDSIPVQERREASVILQIALYNEEDFATLHPLRLIDLSFINEVYPDFVLSDQYRARLDLDNREAVIRRLESTLRRLQSRCMGLLECYYGGTIAPFGGDLGSMIAMAPSTADWPFDEDWIWTLRQRQARNNAQAHALQEVDNLVVDFFHRTCRDFLLTPRIHDLLLEYTGGPYNAQMFLLGARIAQLQALATADECTGQGISLASNIISSLARPALRDTPDSVIFADVVKPCLTTMLSRYDSREPGFYIDPSIDSWEEEQSSFLTLAIDFGMNAYVQHYLTPEYVQYKRGRPILDYVLRPRFPEMFGQIDIGNQAPNAQWLSRVLELGAKPNQLFDLATVWARFLCFAADLFAHHGDKYQYPQYVTAMKMMIRAGADLSLPRRMLSCGTNYSYYTYSRLWNEDPLSETRFSKRWPSVPPMNQHLLGPRSMREYAVRDLMEIFRAQIGSDVDRLKALIARVERNKS